jgi:cytoskeletal protein CcmA (bactofilin family)
MWKRDENVRPTAGRETAVPATPTGTPAAPTAHGPEPESRRQMDARDIVNIGKSVVIKGELNGSEDLTVEGHVEGKIELKEHALTIGPHGRIKAEIFAKSVIVLGEVTGNIAASEKVDIRDNGSVDGNIVSPRVAIAEGAHFRGSVDMQRKTEAVKAGDAPKADVKPAALPAAKV